MTAAMDHTKSEIVMIQPFAESDCFFLTCAHSFNHHEIVERYQKISWTPFRSLSTGLTFFFSFPFFSLSFPSLPFSFSLFVLRDSFAVHAPQVGANLAILLPHPPSTATIEMHHHAQLRSPFLLKS